MRVSTIVGKDDLIKAKLEEGYSFQLLSKELGVGCHTLINYVKGMNSRYERKYPGITFRKPSRLRDLVKRYGIPKSTIQGWLRKGRVKGKKVGWQWIITEWPSQADFKKHSRPKSKTELLQAVFGKGNVPEREPGDESVDRALSTLSPAERLVIEQHFLRNMSLEEIGRTYLRRNGRVGVSRQNVWKTKELGLQKLRQPASLKILLD
jgi:DNA-directed RNA polymerase specialized sigma24 family protein